MLESLNAYNFILVALNLIILYVVLRKILFKPVTSFMEKRTQSIRDSIEEAQKQEAEANDLKLKYENQLSDAKLVGEKIIADATEKSNRISDEIIAKANQEASFIMQKAREEIEHEREQMLKEVYNQVVDLTIGAASKVIESDVDSAKNLKIIKKFLGEEGAA
ncbi:MAG: F0F1 ATP synthase subunit B [Bacillota bacterium]|nr:F0F1 ATP synthase subunit B [Bacillota bacterium]